VCSACGLMISLLDSWDCEFGTHMWNLSANSDYCHRPVQNIHSVREIKRELALTEYG
jgi:hypothetical protein